MSNNPIFKPSARGAFSVQFVDRNIVRLSLTATLAAACTLAGAQVMPTRSVSTQPVASGNALPSLTKNLGHKPGQAEAKKLLDRRSSAERGFIENKGQWPSDVTFLGRSAGLNMWVTKEGLRLDAFVTGAGKVSGHVVGVKFLGGKALAAKGEDIKTVKTDFLGYAKQARGASTYGAVKTQDIYPKIALKTYFEAGHPRYDMLVAAHGNPSKIRMNYFAANGLKVKKDQLAIKTSVGDLVESRLVAYQVVNGKKKTIPASFKQIDKNTVGFNIGSYDHNLALVIDPLIYGSYYGGDSGMDEVHAVISDAIGGVYMTGSTQSPDFPAIFGPYSFNISGAQDAFVSKLEGDAYRHDYAAFLGGSRRDSGEFLQLDQFGDLWVSGYTESEDFPNRNQVGSVQYLDFDLDGSTGHTEVGPSRFATSMIPSGSGHYRLSFPTVGNATTADIPWNASAGAVQAFIAAIPTQASPFGLGNELNGGTVTVQDRTGAPPSPPLYGRGYKITLSAQKATLAVDNSKLGAVYTVTRQTVDPRAEIMNNAAAGTGDYILNVPYNRNGSFVAHTTPISTTANPNVLLPQFNTTGLVPDPADPNQTPVKVPVQIVPAGAANRFLFLFRTTPPGMLSATPKGIDEVQQVDITGATAGTFTLTPPNSTGATGPIFFNASAGTVQASIAAVIQGGGSSVIVTNPNGQPQIYRIEFTGQLANQNLAITTAAFANLTGGARTITTISDGAPPMTGTISFLATGIDEIYWDPTTSHPTGPDPGFGLNHPQPDLNGGAFNLSYAGTFGNPISWAATGAQIQAVLNPLIPPANSTNVIVLPDDSTKTTLPNGTMAACYVGPYSGGHAPATPEIVNDKIIVGRPFDVIPSKVIAAARISPRPLYRIHLENTVFLIRFKQSATNILNPLPTKAYFFGGEQAPAVEGFRIFPHNNPVAGEPIRFAFGGTIEDPGAQLIPQLPAVPRSLKAECGFIFRVNFTEAGGFSVVSGASQYVDAFDDSVGQTGLAYHVTVGGLDVDNNGNVYVGGTIFGPSGQTIDTSTPNQNGHFLFQTTAVDVNGTLREGRLLRNWDGFVRKYSPSGALSYSVLIGGNSRDTGRGVAVDPNGNAYLLGTSTSFNYPRTRGVFGETFDQSYTSTIVKLNPSASDALYATNLRTFDTHDPVGIAVDQKGTAFVTLMVSRGVIMNIGTPGNDPNRPTGFEDKGVIPTTGDAPLKTYNIGPDYGSTAGALMVLDPSATTLLFGSYLGGALDDNIYRPFVDKVGDVWVCGYIDSFRSYSRVARFGGGIQNLKAQATLPAGQISPLAFRPSPDPNIGLGGPGTTLSDWDTYNTEFDADPIDIQAYRDRDGWVNRWKIGTNSITNYTFDINVNGVPQATLPGGLGAFSIALISINSPAPPGGVDIVLSIPLGSPLSFSPTADVFVGDVFIPQGRTTPLPGSEMKVYGRPVTDNVPVDVTATYQNAFRVARVVVVPWLQNFTVAPNQNVGGNTSIGTITLARAATQNLTVPVSSDKPAVIAVSPIQFGVGQQNRLFAVNMKGVDTDTTVTLNAIFLGVGRAVQVIVHPTQLKALSFEPNPVISGSSATGTIILNGAAGPNGFDVNLTMDGSPAGYVFPSTVHIGSGQVSTTFTVQTPIEDATVIQTMNASLVPSAGYTPNTVHAPLTVVADSVQSLAIDPSTVDGGDNAVGQVTLDSPALENGAVVNLSVSPDDGTVTIPPSVTVPQGATSAKFNISTATVLSTTTYTITASRKSSSQSATLTINGLNFNLITPPVVQSGGTDTGTVSLSGPAPASGLAVQLTSSNPTVLAVPGTITIAPGNTDANFTMVAGNVLTDTNVTITAKVGSKTKSAIVTVHATLLTGMTITPNYVLNLNTARCTLTLDGPAPLGGLKVTLTNSNKLIAAVPTSVTIPAGATSYSFSIATYRVTRTLTTTITGSASNGALASATLTVHN